MHSITHVKRTRRFLTLLAACIIVAAATISHAQTEDHLPSWNDGSNKRTIVDSISGTATKGHENLIPADKRIAVFDNDGSLWSEQPLYFQAMCIFDRIKELAPDHPEWQQTEPFASVLKGDPGSAMSGGQEAPEWAYDRDSQIGRLISGLDEGPERDWKIISMKKDWERIYP